MVAAVEGHHLAVGRQVRRHPPQKIMGGLGPGRPAERPGMEASRVCIGSECADQAVLATGIRAMDHQQQRLFAVGPEPALVFPDVFQAGLKRWHTGAVIQLCGVMPQPRLFRVQKPGTGKGRVLHQGNSLGLPGRSSCMQTVKLRVSTFRIAGSPVLRWSQNPGYEQKTSRDSRFRSPDH